MRRVGNELPLPREGVVEAVEHVVERLRERADLLAGPTGADAVGQVAGVDGRRGPGHPPERVRGARGHEASRHEGAEEGERARDEECLGHALLRSLHRSQRLAHPHDAHVSAGSLDGTADHTHGPDVLELDRGEAGRRGEQQPRLAVLPLLSLRVLAFEVAVQSEQLGVVGDDAAVGELQDEQPGRGAEGLGGHVAAAGGSEGSDVLRLSEPLAVEGCHLFSKL